MYKHLCLDQKAWDYVKTDKEVYGSMLANSKFHFHFAMYKTAT